MELRQLRYFLHIADLGSISLASSALHVAQPALTRQLQNLEVELESKLVERHARGVRPTAAGLVLLERARHILTEVDQLAPLVKARGSLLRGTVALGMPIPVTPILSSRLLARCAREYPDISLRIVEGFSSLLHEWLLSGSVTIAMLYGAAQKRSIESIPIVVEDLYVVGANTPENREVECYTPRELAALSLVLPHEPHLICDSLRRTGVELNVATRADALGVMKDFAERGVGYTVLPLSAVSRDVEMGRLVAVPIRNPNISQTVCLCSSKLRNFPEIGVRVMRLVEDEAHAMVSEGRWPGGSICR